ncbi:MAG: glycosyltransferase family 2 protein [bacterium]
MKDNLPSVSIIIPCRNEEGFIKECLDSILNQDYPKDKIEILVVDGMSEDKTREILKKYQEEYLFIKVLDNFKKITPTALNVGIRAARGEIIVRMDSHAGYDKEYVSKSVEYLEKYDADNIGGIMLTLPADNSLTAKAIVLSLSHPFGVGNSYFRMKTKEPRSVDTVFGGCYRKEIFNKIGFFNEKLLKSQDMEFNLRLKKAGGKILLFPDIISRYYPKPDFKNFFLHDLNNGFWIIYSLKFAKVPLRLRHYAPFVFVFVLLLIGILSIFFLAFFYIFIFMVGLYFLLSLCFSANIAIKEKEIRLLFLMPIAFVIRHLGYGIGSTWGLIRLFKE